MQVRSRGSCSPRHVMFSSRWGLPPVLVVLCAGATFGLEPVNEQRDEAEVRALVVEAVEGSPSTAPGSGGGLAIDGRPLTEEQRAREAERALADADPEQPMSADLTTTQLVDRALSRERFQSALLLPFGLGSVLLAALGVFGMASDTANRRLREVALRQALGANRRRVLAELLRSTLTCVLTGLCAGLLLAVATGRTLNLALFETNLADPWIVVAVCSLVLGVSLAACIGPAARVVRADVGAMLRQ